MRVAHDSIEAKDKKKEDTATKKAEFTVRSSRISTHEGRGRGSMDSTTGRSAYFFVPRTNARAQPSILSVLRKREKEEADRVTVRCLFWGDIPLSITKKNPFWQPMCDAIAVVGPWYKSATFEELCGGIFQEKKKDINSILMELTHSCDLSSAK